MNPESSDIQARYNHLSNDQLRELSRDSESLTPTAQAAIASELGARGLQGFDKPSQRQTEAAPSEPPPPSLVTVGRYRDLSEAVIARSALEASGINAFLQDENMVRMDWFWSNMIGGMRLQVEPEDAPAAIALLEAGVPPVLEVEDEHGEEVEMEQPACRHCGSHEVTFQGRDRRAAILSLYVMGVPLPFGKESWSCESCGAKWREEDAESPEA